MEDILNVSNLNVYYKNKENLYNTLQSRREIYSMS